MDGTDFRICNPSPFWSGWFSHKFKGPGLRYEIGLAIQSGDIVWVNGPFPCGQFPDIAIFRRALKNKLMQTGERAEADLGYRGEPLTIDLPNEGCFTHNQKYIKQVVRSRHETVNSRFKNFGILNQKFRHERSFHKVCFYAIASITQLSIEYGDKSLFSVRNYKTQSLQ